jgi:hypothetical protein
MSWQRERGRERERERERWAPYHNMVLGLQTRKLSVVYVTENREEMGITLASCSRGSGLEPRF